MSQATPNQSVVVNLQARTGMSVVDFPELWRYRDLLWLLAVRDIKVRYKQTVVGAAWALFQPLMTMLVFTVLFSLMGHVPASDGVPYFVSTYCALLPWQLFATSLTASSESLVANQNLISKVYFPRVIIPLAPIIGSLLDFVIAFGILVVMMVWVGVGLRWSMLALPLFVGFAVLTAFAAGLWLSALNARYRDIRYVVPAMMQLGMFISPVVYETTAVIPQRWQLLYGLNPMVGVLEGFRWALLGQRAPSVLSFSMSFVGVLFLLVSGMIYFRRVEQTVADVV